jgi:mannose/cellobiose epimerase-like protein (N-acyl-D-glucosamine 2-epimerase family)
VSISFVYPSLLRALLIGLCMCFISAIGISQELPEKRLTKEQMQRPGVAVLVERLKTLRRNAERFGPKHPSLPAITKQIVELESQLIVLLGAPAVVSPPKSESGSLKPSVEPRKGYSSVDRKQPSRMARSSAWGLDPWSQWPKNLQELKSQTDLISGYREAYPQLGVKVFIAAGAMPGMGLLWGISYDPSNDRSSVYQWYDSSRADQAELYFETSGRLLSIYFPSDFDRTGVFWGVNSSSILGSSIEILEVTSDRFPPYGVTDLSRTAIARLKIDSLDDLKVFSSQQQGLYLHGVHGFEEAKPASNANLRARSKDDGLWILDCVEDKGYKRCEVKVHQGNERTIEQLIKGDFLNHGTAYRDYQYLGLDSLGELMVVDRGGRLVKFADTKGKQVRESVTETWPPRKLSQLGGYQSMVDGAFIEGFQKYEPVGLDHRIGNPESQGSCVSRSFVGDKLDLSVDYWVCYPRGTLARSITDTIHVVPDGTLLLESISVPSSWLGVQVSTKSTFTIETRLLVLCEHQWYAFSYLWDEEQSDAVLVENQEKIEFLRENPQGRAAWMTTKSESCYECHAHGPIGFRSGVIRQESMQESGLLSKSPVWGQVSDFGSALAMEPRIGWMPMLVRSDSLRSRQYIDQGLSAREFDWGWFKESLLTDHLDLWYRTLPRPDGFFPSDFDSKWSVEPHSSASLVTQSSYVLDMARAYEIFGDQKYLDALNRGADFLRERFRDPSYGGYYFRVHEQGRVMDRSKDGYGHAFAIHSLAAATNATGDQRYAQEAMECWRIVRSEMMQSGGGLVSRASEDFSGPQVCLLGANAKLLEGLLELYRTTRDQRIGADILQLLEFFTGQMRDQSGAIPEDCWPVSKVMQGDGRKPEYRLGNQVQWAYLLSLAIQEGFPRKYLAIGEELMDYAIQNGYDASSGRLHSLSDTDTFISDEFEFLRALLRYYAMHGHQEYLSLIVAIQKNIQTNTIGSGEVRWPHLMDGKKRSYTQDVSRGVAMCIEGIEVGRLVQRTVQGIVRVK